jgi:hypothetical protein
MNALTLELTTPAIDETSLFQRARGGDLDACAALLDEIAPDVYGEVLLEVRNAHEAQRVTDDALIAVMKPLHRGEISSVLELRWRVASRARIEAAALSGRREQLTGVRASIRHLFGALAASGLAIYATVLAI